VDALAGLRCWPIHPNGAAALGVRYNGKWIGIYSAYAKTLLPGELSGRLSQYFCPLFSR
jgi:hypothetical protein